MQEIVKEIRDVLSEVKYPGTSTFKLFCFYKSV